MQVDSDTHQSSPQDLAITVANRENASYVIAQDPDSDRFAAAEKG